MYDFETGEAKEIPIDALKGPVAAAEALYKKARKQRRTAGAVEPLLEAASREAEYLEQVEFSLRELTGQGGKDDVLALEEIDAELVDARLVKPTGKGAAAEIKRQEISERRRQGEERGNALEAQEEGRAGRSDDQHSEVRRTQREGGARRSKQPRQRGGEPLHRQGSGRVVPRARGARRARHLAAAARTGGQRRGPSVRRGSRRVSLQAANGREG